MHESAAAAAWDATYPAYYQLADVLKSVAESHCNVHIDNLTLLRWRELMGIMREIDTHVDDTAATPLSTISEIQRFDIFRDRYPNLTPEALQPNVHNNLLSRTNTILRIGHYLTRANSVYRFIRLRGAEAVQTAELFADSATEEVRSQPQFSDTFMPILRELGIAACMLDSAHDAPDDYRQNKITLQPKVSFRMRTAIAAAKHTIPLLGVSFHKPVLHELWKASHIRADRKKYAQEFIT
ncbi:MAG TPA: hypothetical protein VF575_04410 [Candidatus Saccharimonadales bacterium]|jgi:hypothetical protein